MDASPQESKPTDALAPSGTVTFLFTDIEGSTRLLERLLEKYALVLDGQRSILRAAFARWNGREIDTQGDSFFTAFPRAIDAVNCAIEAQRELAAATWPEEAVVRVRMGLHTGEPIVVGEGRYIGMDVNRAARIAAAGHGGQILLSQSTRELVFQDLPKGASLSDLGSFKLKDIRYPQQIYQVNILGLPSEFPELKTLSAEEEPPQPGESPYKGLQNFEEQDAEWFFGREAVTARLVAALSQANFLALIGASGSGKSSVARAGLVPALKRDPAGDWTVAVLTPTMRPLESLAAHLTKHTAAAGAALALMDDMHRDVRSLHAWLRQNQAAGAVQPRTLLVIDQFEELFTLCQDETEQRQFVENLLYATELEGSTTKVVITLRADFYEHLAKFAGLRQVVAKNQEYIGVMNAQELRQAIEGPAQKGGWEFTLGLVDLILYDLGAGAGRQPEPGALPLLSHALLETWKRRRGYTMTLKGYNEVGGARGAIAHTAEQIYYGVFSPEQRLIARSIFLRLTDLGKGTQDTRRRASLSELKPDDSQPEAAPISQVLNRLADARLITISDEGVEVAHEALIREWPALREWLAEDREGLQVHRRLTEAALEWLRLERDPGLLFRGARLAGAQEWAAANPGQLNAIEIGFLEASRLAVEQEQIERESARQRELEIAEQLLEAEKKRSEEQALSAKRSRRWAIFLGVTLLATTLLAGAAFVFSQQSRQATRLATSRELAAASISNLDVDPERSILLALEAVDRSTTQEAVNALHRAVLTSRILKTTAAHEGPIWTMAYSPDGSRLATGGVDKKIQIWDAASQEHLLTIDAHDLDVDSLSFSPDGKWLASSSDDGTAKIWDAASGELVQTLSGHTDWVTGVAYRPDGEQMATLSLDGSIKLWDAADGSELATWPEHDFTGPFLSYSPDGERLYFVEAEELRAVDAGSGEVIFAIPASADLSEGIFAVSPDSQRLAVIDGGLVRIVDASDGGTLFTITGPTNTVYHLAFSPDGAVLAAAGLDRKIYLWDVASGIPLFNLSGHEDGISRLVFSPDGKQILSGDLAGNVKTWALAPTAEVLTIPTQVERMAQSPDGSRIATTLDALRVWNAQTGKLLYEREAHDGRLIGVSFSPDGQHIATGGRDQIINLWDAGSGEVQLSIPVEDSRVYGLAYRPDGKALAIAGNSGIVQIFDPATGAPLQNWDAGMGVLSAAAFSPDGAQLAVSSYGSDDAKIFDAASGKELFVLKGHQGSNTGITDVAYDTSGTRLVTSGRDTTARIWDTATGELLQRLTGHTSTVTAARFSPDGKLVATNGQDAMARVWDAASGAPLLAINMQYGGNGLEFTPDGQRLVVGDEEQIKVIALRLDELIAIAKDRLTRSFETIECEQYLHLEACP